ncbi:hypothetical protein [Corallococcus sp. CA049B]|uniref:hypothetical protein n=1 Tax=Corallococcus sp. CA049B TaxID=2316730 RepID=UPI0011C4501D|nr:hypothetical protein [Corallococcus sp. CA049B]
MSLPTDSEYQEAVQNPSQVFSDSDLKSGQPELTSPALPFPKARSGNFATVYRLNCGTQSWAVRCFTRSIHHDQKRRYAEISRHLEVTKLRYAVGFTFIEKGIQVRGQWLPILKMEWLNGESLGSHIERNLRSPKALLALATKWVEMMRALRQSGIAHGDLQHGNVLIVGDELRLIDYDGMFVPSLAGSTSYERGHDNYQHPKRGDLFGPDLDNFSAWVVLISILALASQPQLWGQFKCGDDCLLFRKRDFAEPEKSKVLLTLLNSREQGVRSLTALFKTLLSLPAGQVPPLDGNLLQTATPTSQLSAIPSWVGDHKSTHAPRFPTAPSSQAPVGAPASWVLDFVEPPTKASAQFVGSKAREQVITAYSVIFAIVIGVGVFGAALPALTLFFVPFVALLVVLFLLLQHCREPAVQARAQARRSLQAAEKEAHKGESLIASLANELRHVKSELAALCEQYRKVEEAIQKRKAKELERHNAKYQSERAQITQKQRAADLFESDRLGIIQRDSGARISGLQQRIAEVTFSEQSEMDDALRALQKQFISTALHRATLGNADIPGVKAALKYKLDMAGFYTAASISSPHAVQHVHGIGPARAHALWVWRQEVERQARSMMPTKLDGSTTQNIRSKYAKIHVDLELELDRMWQQNADEVNDVRVQVTRERERLAVLELQAEGSLKTAELAVRDRFAPEFAQAKTEMDATSSVAHKAISQLEGKLQAARAEVFRLQYRREVMRRGLSSYDAVRFGKYIRRLVTR